MIPIAELITKANFNKQSEADKRLLLKWYISLNTGINLGDAVDKAVINDRKLFNKNSKIATSYFKTFIL